MVEKTLQDFFDNLDSVERIVTGLSAGFVDRIVGDGGGKTRTCTSSKGVTSTSTEKSGRSDGGNNDTSDSSTSQTCSDTNRRRCAVTSLGNVTTSVLGGITSGNGTVIGLRALQGDLLATTSVIASSVVADIYTLASNLGVLARVGKVGGLGVAFVLGASAVVVTEVSRESSVVARVSSGCSLRVAGIDGAGVVVVASLGDVLLDEFADGGLVILLVRPEARVVSASVLIVTVSIDGAGRGRALKIGVVDGTSLWVAFVLVAFVGSRDGGFLLRATGLLVASELDTLVGVTLGAVGGVLLDEASGRVARVLVASIRSRDRDISVDASEFRVASSLLTLVGLVTNAVRGSEGNGTSGRVALVDGAFSGGRYGDIGVDASFL
jgi:hypothetical protein